MKQLFKEQLEKNKVVTDENISLIKDKNYYNGDKIQVGDKPLFAMIEEYIDKGDNMTECNVKLIKIKEEHFDLYEVDESARVSKVPTIKLKNS